MGELKNLATDISYSLGLNGDLTPDVFCVAERVLAVHRENEPMRKTQAIMGISRLMRELRSEIAFEQGKLCKRTCAWCGETLGYTEGTGVTHGICESCKKKLANIS